VYHEKANSQTNYCDVMTNTFIPHFSCRITPSVLNHRAYTTSSAAARNLYDSSGLKWGKEMKILMIENGRFFFGTPQCQSYLKTPHLQENRSVRARLPLQYNFIILFLLEFIKMYTKKKKV
jgi:hypothetical protein